MTQRLQAHGVIKRHRTFLTGTGKLQYQARIPEAGRFDKPHAVTRTLERKLDMRGDLRQRGAVPGGKVQVLRRTVQDLMGSRLTGKPVRSAAAPTPGARADPAADATGATC